MKKTKRSHKTVKPLTVGRDLRRGIYDSQGDLKPFKTKTPTKNLSPDLQFLKRFNHEKIDEIDIRMEGNFEDWSILFSLQSREEINPEFVMKFIKELGSGAYGTVYKIKINEKYTDNEYHFALKIDKGDTEYEISKKLFMKCNTIQNKFFMNNEEYYLYFMTLADGDLLDYKENYLKKMKPKKAHQHILEICEEIRKQAICILENDLLYADMKPLNCLYKFSHKKPFFLIGDLGGAAMDDTGEQASTYIPYELMGDETGWFKSKDITNKEKENFLSWEIGVMLYTLSPKVNDGEKCKFFDPQFLYYNNPCSKKYDKLLERAQKNLNQWYGKNFGDYLNKDPSSRISIYKIL